MWRCEQERETLACGAGWGRAAQPWAGRAGRGETNQEQCGGVNERGSRGGGEQHNPGQGGMTRNEQSEDGVTDQKQADETHDVKEPEKIIPDQNSDGENRVR